MPAEPDGTVQLPVIVDLAPGEALDGYLERVADANQVTSAHLVSRIRTASGPVRFLTLAPHRATVDAIASLTGLEPAAIHGATLTVYDASALDLTGLDPTTPSSYRAAAARGWFPGRGTQLCPACLAADGTWQLTWRLRTTTVCPVHHTYLLGTCPGCARPFRDQRHSPLRIVGAHTRCGNPLGHGPRQQCTVDLTALPTTAADPTCVDRQRRHDHATTGAATPTALGDLDPGDYLASVRALAVLLLHIAGTTPSADGLPAWAGALHDGSRPHRTRWGLRPPRDPQLRSRVLTAADTILTAPDLDTAIDRFEPWLHAVPATTDGRLGWLADHTRMTPTLTHLVMAAHAPRRRLSRLLDTQPPLTPTLRHIPQVLPKDQYDAHLTGLFTCRPETVRLFTSLCIARTHPDVTTWAQAATALELPADLGERTARACSAGQLATPHAVAAAITATAAHLGAVDYRDREQRVRHLAGRRRWFTGWARAHRPGTRAGSHRYAVHWMWTHVSHAHPSTVPRAGIVETARATRFSASLTEWQQATLTGLVRAPGDPTRSG